MALGVIFDNKPLSKLSFVTCLYSWQIILQIAPCSREQSDGDVSVDGKFLFMLYECIFCKPCLA